MQFYESNLGSLLKTKKIFESFWGTGSQRADGAKRCQSTWEWLGESTTPHVM